MRVHINVEDETLIEAIDTRVGPRGRSAFFVNAAREKLESEVRWEKIWSAVGSISDEGHPWDEDVAKWVHDSRREDPRRVG
jgi:hypothetical protein